MQIPDDKKRFVNGSPKCYWVGESADPIGFRRSFNAFHPSKTELFSPQKRPLKIETFGA
jgi:hypothetical protein